MKNILKLSIAIALSTVIITGCKKDSDSNPKNTSLHSLTSSLDPITDFFQVIGQNVSGHITLTSYTSLAMQSQPCNSTQFVGGYHKRTGERICFGPEERTVFGKKKISYVQVPCEECDPMFETTAWGNTVTLVADQESIASTYEHDVYVPTKVEISAPSFIEHDFIHNGKSISWNADASNPKDDVIYIVYDPTSYENDGIGGDAVTRGIPVGKTGSHTFTSTDLAGIPEGAYVKVSVNRYNFEIFTNPELEEDFLVVAGSTVMAGFYVDETE